jgi:ATP-dependent Lhr-like helicase
MESENLLAAVFPDQLACLEHIVGDREIPDHPLVNQTMNDCLTEAMDIEGLEEVLRKIERGEIRCIARDLPEPSPLASEILNARPYAFLDNAPLEERRTQAVLTRRASDHRNGDDLGILDVAAIEKVQAEAWPNATNADELHDALMLVGTMTEDEIHRTVVAQNGASHGLIDELVKANRTTQLLIADKTFWIAAERLPTLRAIYTDAKIQPEISAPETNKVWEHSDAIRELIRGRLEVCGPITVIGLGESLQLPLAEIEAALLALEAEGFVLRGKFNPSATEMEWCDRRLLARIHRLTINRLRAEIQPVSIHEFYRFLFAWQRVDAEHRAAGPEGLEAVLELLDGCELPLASWETEVLRARVNDYDPQWLDRLCFSGRVGWGRLTAPQNPKARASGPLRTSPIALYLRDNLDDWLHLSESAATMELSTDTRSVLETLQHGGALFFAELVRRTNLLPSQVEQALSELAALGFVTCDGFDGLRALLVPSNERPTFGRNEGVRRRKTTDLASVEFAGRWSLLRREASANGDSNPLTPALFPSDGERGKALEKFARVFLRRYGVVFRRMVERETFPVSWYELGKIYRRWEARGEIRGGYFVSGVSGEQFALPEAIALLRSIRKAPGKNELIVLSAADPLNLQGILTPGPRVAALTSNRILFNDGLPVSAMEAGEINRLAENSVADSAIESSLRIGKLPSSLRPYYK